jgi:hypothetical protein
MRQTIGLWEGNFGQNPAKRGVGLEMQIIENLAGFINLVQALKAAFEI